MTLFALVLVVVAIIILLDKTEEDHDGCIEIEAEAEKEVSALVSPGIRVSVRLLSDEEQCKIVRKTDDDEDGD